LLVEGSNLLNSGEYAEALDRFEKAYQLVQSPKIYYNYGLAYEGLDRPAEAMRSFESFLAEAGDAPATNVANARQHLSKLSRKVTVVQLEGDVAGAEVSVDGRAFKSASRILVDPGMHQITVEKSGRQPFLH